MAAKKTSRTTDSSLATNRKARRDYHVLESFEAGIVLIGTEVKSVRNRQLSLDESYARIDGNELFLLNMHIMPYEFGNQFNHETRRPRKLLLHRREITRLDHQMKLKGHSLIPLKVYLTRGVIKIQLGLCRGKQMQDKREDIKRRTADRESARAIAQHYRG